MVSTEIQKIVSYYRCTYVRMYTNRTVWHYWCIHTEWIVSDPVLSKGTLFQTNDPFHWHIHINILANTLNMLRLSVYTGDITTSFRFLCLSCCRRKSKASCTCKLQWTTRNISLHLWEMSCRHHKTSAQHQNLKPSHKNKKWNVST
jgi:hypothetical protein